MKASTEHATWTRRIKQVLFVVDSEGVGLLRESEIPIVVRALKDILPDYDMIRFHDYLCGKVDPKAEDEALVFKEDDSLKKMKHRLWTRLLDTGDGESSSSSTAKALDPATLPELTLSRAETILLYLCQRHAIDLQLTEIFWQINPSRKESLTVRDLSNYVNSFGESWSTQELDEMLHLARDPPHFRLADFLRIARRCRAIK